MLNFWSIFIYLNVRNTVLGTYNFKWVNKSDDIPKNRRIARNNVRGSFLLINRSSVECICRQCLMHGTPGPNNMCCPNAGLLLAHRLRRWANSSPTLGECSGLVGYMCTTEGSLLIWIRPRPAPADLSGITPPPPHLTQRHFSINPYSAGIDFRRQNLTSVDVRL